MSDLVRTAPDGRSTASFTWAGEIRFGPEYFSLAVNGVKLKGRIFGDEALWSPDSRYLAVQEWLTTDYAKGPQTQLLLIDLEGWRECPVSRADKGFIAPTAFEGANLHYKKAYHGEGITRHFEIDFLALDRWRALP